MSTTTSVPSGAFGQRRFRPCAPILLLALLLCAAWLPAVHAAAPAASVAAPEQLMQAGMLAFRSGRFRDALEDWSLAASGYENAGDRKGQARALAQSAQADLRLGRVPDALDKLERARSLAQGVGDRALLAAIAGSRGEAYSRLGRNADAERELRSSVELARQASEPRAAAAALNNLGNLFANEGRLGDAARTYREALGTAEQAGDKALAVRASTNLARALVDGGRYGEAMVLLTALDPRLRALEPSHDKAYELISVGRLYTTLWVTGYEPRVEWSRNAYEALQAALAVADRIGDVAARSYALGYMGTLYEQGKRYDDALRLTQQASVAAEQANAPEILYLWQWQEGRLLKAQGHDKQAILAYEHAVYTLKSVRDDLSARGPHATFRDTAQPVFYQLADLLLQESGKVPPDQATQYLLAARSTIEVLKGAELQDYFQDDCVAALRARTTGIDHLGAHTAALYPIVLQDRLELLLTLPEGIKRFTVPVTAEALTHEVREFRRLLEKKTTFQFYPYARKLYGWLIEPISAQLEKDEIDTLVFIPDGALRTIPIAALHDGKEYLIARYAIATTPGLTLTDARPIPRGNVEVMLNGLTESVQGFPPLPYVGRELKEIKALYGGTVLENRQFTIPNMERDLERRPYSIVHIASHGQFGSNVDKTFLLTYNGKLSMDQLESFLGISKYRKNAVELLTLSACQTAAGDDRAALGLAGVAIKAGARSALATLWTVNDPASAALVSDFYRDLRNPAVSKAKALQQAQLAVLKDPRYRHPNYWSAFLLIGNWL
jgi:CHAT domain-containing protein